MFRKLYGYHLKTCSCRDSLAREEDPIEFMSVDFTKGEYTYRLMYNLEKQLFGELIRHHRQTVLTLQSSMLTGWKPQHSSFTLSMDRDKLTTSQPAMCSRLGDLAMTRCDFLAAELEKGSPWHSICRSTWRGPSQTLVCPPREDGTGTECSRPTWPMPTSNVSFGTKEVHGTQDKALRTRHADGVPRAGQTVAFGP